MREQYQTEWRRGAVVSRGVRECDHRYQVIREFCEQYTRPFTVLDVGANLGYFSLRLAEDFDCTVVAVEGAYGTELARVLAENQNPRVIMLHREMSLADLACLADVEHFDVTLAMSVVHHLGPFDETVEVLRRMGDHLILEIPVEDNACNPQFHPRSVPDGVLLGWGASHLRDTDRPIYLLSQPKSGLEAAYLGSEEGDVDVVISSSFDAKTVAYGSRDEVRGWWRGINLQTFLSFGGRVPSREAVAGMVRSEWDGEPHGDVQAWNIVLQGDGVKFIDRLDPRRHQYDDHIGLERVFGRLSA